MRHSRRSDCPTRKVRYRDRQEAKRALSQIKSSKYEARHVTPTRYYECDMCHGWHLTSQVHNAPWE